MKCEIYNESGVDYCESDGGRYALGLNPDRYRHEFRAMAESREVIGRSEAIKIVESADFGFGRHHFGPETTKDQNGYGKCASSAATYAVEKARHIRNQKPIALSDDYLYSLVNDGRDRGSTLGENMEAITSRGIATRATVGKGDIYRRKYNTSKADKEALRFRSWEAFVVNSEAEMITALINQIPVVVAIHVGRNWRRFDNDGVLIGDRGPGNHSEHCDDVRYNRRKERFEFRKHSSHSRSYGDGGFCWITWSHVSTVHRSHQKYAVPGAIDDPLGENPFQGEFNQDDEPVATARIVVESSNNCHWCTKWASEVAPRLKADGIDVQAGNVDGLQPGVPQFELFVGNQQSKKKRGFWSYQEIRNEIANLQTQGLIA